MLNAFRGSVTPTAAFNAVRRSLRSWVPGSGWPCLHSPSALKCQTSPLSKFALKRSKNLQLCSARGHPHPHRQQRCADARSRQRAGGRAHTALLHQRDADKRRHKATQPGHRVARAQRKATHARGQELGREDVEQREAGHDKEPACARRRGVAEAAVARCTGAAAGNGASPAPPPLLSSWAALLLAVVPLLPLLPSCQAGQRCCWQWCLSCPSSPLVKLGSPLAFREFRSRREPHAHANTEHAHWEPSQQGPQPKAVEILGHKTRASSLREDAISDERDCDVLGASVCQHECDCKGIGPKQAHRAAHLPKNSVTSRSAPAASGTTSSSDSAAATSPYDTVIGRWRVASVPPAKKRQKAMAGSSAADATATSAKECAGRCRRPPGPVHMPSGGVCAGNAGGAAESGMPMAAASPGLGGSTALVAGSPLGPPPGPPPCIAVSSADSSTMP
eukprot:356602-Chlamydomonas_euryale.AAC.15